MLLIPEIETVFIRTPRTGSRAIKLAIQARYPKTIELYHHMEADGVPTGYDRWRKIGVVRHPLERLWSLYKYLSSGLQIQSRYPTYAAAMKASVAIPFSDWILTNRIVFTSPYSTTGAMDFYPMFAVRHALPENWKSQFLYLRPDLGTKVYEYEMLAGGGLYAALDITPTVTNASPRQKRPAITAEAAAHVARVNEWEIDTLGYCIRELAEAA
jgi:hypothetical protein